MPRVEDEVDFLKNVENVMDTEQNRTATQEDDETTHEDTKCCSWDVGEPYNISNSNLPVSPRKPNETLSDFSKCQRRRSLPSPLPTNFANQDDVFHQEPRRRRTITDSSTSNHNLHHNLKEYGSMTYTSLKSELRQLSKTGNDRKKGIELQLKRLNQEENLSKTTSGKKTDIDLSSLGIHEETFESGCMGDWTAIDLDFNVYEMKQAQDVAYLREKRKRKNRLSIPGRCWFI